MPEDFDAVYWESRYRDHVPHAGRPPHPELVAAAEQLAPGTALDAGCGDGGNALWLAERGWLVTAVDVSPTALRRAREHAERCGTGVADRIHWLEADLTDWAPPREHFDLVTSHYVHPAGYRQDVLRRLAAAVAPNGTLFLVDHDPSDEHAHAHSSAEELTGVLDPQGWDVQFAGSRARQGSDHQGRAMTIRDVMLRARKVPEPGRSRNEGGRFAG